MAPGPSGPGGGPPLGLARSPQRRWGVQRSHASPSAPLQRPTNRGLFVSFWEVGGAAAWGCGPSGRDPPLHPCSRSTRGPSGLHACSGVLRPQLVGGGGFCLLDTFAPGPGAPRPGGWEQTPPSGVSGQRAGALSPPSGPRFPKGTLVRTALPGIRKGGSKADPAGGCRGSFLSQRLQCCN